jgi:serine/threonine protein kinase
MNSRVEWERIDAALDELLALPPEDWPSACKRISAGDAQLQRELENLLAHVGGEDPILDFPARGDASEDRQASAGLAPGTRVGAYSVIELIGRGGMGEVYRAERVDGQFEQQVAIKLMRAEMGERTRRFHAERRILARLEHPNIARLHDGGVSEDGRPYMVMELIIGHPITAWCREHRTTLQQRIRLFAEVCSAVAYAHRNLVVHRDLKPSNVLVTDDGGVRLLDFGVARLLDRAPNDETRYAALTPGYAAPEQLTGGAVTTATDVYALGTLLYELVAGATPWGGADESLAALVRRVVHEEPPSASVFAAARGDAPVSPRDIAGDLDAIIAKAMRKEPAQRYESVTELQADLTRMLRSEPVAARDGARWYVVDRFLRRHRIGVIASAAVVLAVVAGTALALWQATRAQSEAHRARVVQAFLLSLFKSNDPNEASDHEITVRELLATGSLQLDRELQSQPLALAELHSDLGDIYGDMSDYRQAKLQLDRALTLYAALGQERSAEGIEALFRRGFVLLEERNYVAARNDLQRCIEWGNARFGARNRWAVGAHEKLAFAALQLGDRSGALRIAEEGLALPIGEDAAYDAVRRLRLKATLGQIQVEIGDLPAARATFAAVLADSAHVAGYGAVDRFVTRIQLARAIYYSGDYAEAARQIQVVVPEMDRALGPTYDRTIFARQLLGQSLAALGHYEEACNVERENLANVIARKDPDAEKVAIEKEILASQLRRAMRGVEAQPLIFDALRFLDGKYPQHTLDTEYFRRVAGDVLIASGDLAGGTRLLETAFRNDSALPDFKDSMDHAGLLDSLAAAHRLAGDWDAASDLVSRSCAIVERGQGGDSEPARRCDAEREWIRALRAPSDPDAAMEFAAAAERYRRKLPAGHVAIAELAFMRSDLEERQGHPDPALRRAAEEQWRAALHVAPPAHILFLH